MCTIQACLQGMLRGYQTRSYLEGIPLLQYVNDTMFFMEGSMEEAKNLSTLLDLFADVSGLQINHSKLAFMDFGLTHEERFQGLKALGTPKKGSLPMRYLGLPLKKCRMSMTDRNLVIEKVEKRLEGWQAKLLSRGGWFVLLRLVIIARALSDQRVEEVYVHTTVLSS